MQTGYFITGTDTGVGKTLISCALLHAFARAGLSTIGMKPIAAGFDINGQRINEDVAALNAASTVQAPLQRVNPYLFQAAIAPHIAAAEESLSIELAPIGSAFVELSRLAEVVIVEGVGGFCVPLNDHQDAAHMAQMLALPVILVVGMRLGCLNHALLTQEAIVARGLKIAGWVANCIEPDMPRLDENIASLQQRLKAPLLGIVPYAMSPDVRQIHLDLP